MRTPARSLALPVYQQLRAGIVSLKMAPGSPLVEVEVCGRLHVSRTPVRAALERLHQEGLVTLTGSRTRGRALVAPLTPEDMRDLFLLVGALDGVAARLAAELGMPARRRLVKAAATANRKLRALSVRTRASDIPLAQELDLHFHRIYEQAAGPRLLAKLTSLHAQRERYVRLYTQALVQTHSLEESLAEHDAILAAIDEGDGEAAERQAAFNYRNALARYDRLAPPGG